MPMKTEPFDGDAGPSEDIHPWNEAALDTCPYCNGTMDWLGCSYCEMSGLYDGKACPLCEGYGGWYSCEDCELVVTLDNLIIEVGGPDDEYE